MVGGPRLRTVQPYQPSRTAKISASPNRMMPAMIAVGTVIAHRPRTDPDGPNSGIRFLSRVFDGKSHIWPGVEVSTLRKPVAGQPRHPLPREAILLTAAPQRAVPEPCHVAMECGDRRAVRGNRVIGKVASNDLCQPTSFVRVLAGACAYAVPSVPVLSAKFTPPFGTSGTSALLRRLHQEPSG